MIEELVVSATHPVISWSDAEPLSAKFGPKATRLLCIPRPWIPRFVLVSAASAAEAIWDRGTYKSEVLNTGGEPICWQRVSDALSNIVRSADGKQTAIVIQSYV